MLTFASAPDFETPGCGAGNDANVCVVVIKVSDGDEGTADDAYWGGSAGGLDQGNALHHLRGCGWEPSALGGELTHLRLSGLGAEGVKALAEVLRGNLTLQSLE